MTAEMRNILGYGDGVPFAVRPVIHSAFVHPRPCGAAGRRPFRLIRPEK